MMKFVLVVFAALFAYFPLTDTDIWWHLACARDWVTAWTPVRSPVVNVHEFFQQTVAVVYRMGGAPLLVLFKSLLWGIVFALFLQPIASESRRRSVWQSQQVYWFRVAFLAVLFFIFRFQFEIRPVVFTLLFLGIYWNVVPGVFSQRNSAAKKIIACGILFLLQWVWCKFQGLYILGPLFVSAVFLQKYISFDAGLHSENIGNSFNLQFARKSFLPWGLFPLALFFVPFFHREGLSLFLYPFGLLDRLLGLSPSATLFASHIAENRSPFTLLLAGENILASAVMIYLAFFSIGLIVFRFRLQISRMCLLVTAILTLVAERNFVLFLPVFSAYLLQVQFPRIPLRHFFSTISLLVLFFLFGMWLRSQRIYDDTMVSFQRVPVAAAEWMKANPHSGRLFNDDRAGGYLAFVNPADSIYIDGRFILKTADFFKLYLQFADNPADFLHYADSTGIDRILFPLRYYARWNKVIDALNYTEVRHSGSRTEILQENSPKGWHPVYCDAYFVVFDKY